MKTSLAKHAWTLEANTGIKYWHTQEVVPRNMEPETTSLMIGFSDQTGPRTDGQSVSVSCVKQNSKWLQHKEY